MTAHDAKENFLDAIKHRVRGYLIKPVEHEELESQIRALGREIILDKTMDEQLRRRKEAEKALMESETILKAVNYASELFFKYNYTTQSIADVLETTGRSNGC